jgi:glyoxylase-like metal-dependent hydrolase (beta-lactamase superfamily II)
MITWLDDEPAAEAVADRIRQAGRRVHLIRADVTRLANIESMVADTVRLLGALCRVDTCTGEDKGHPPFDFPGKERWRNELFALGIGYEKIDYVFCTHLHIDHTGWNTTLRDGRWVPTFPHAKYVFRKREYAAWEAEHTPILLILCSVITACRSWKPGRPCSWMTTTL